MFGTKFYQIFNRYKSIFYKKKNRICAAVEETFKKFIYPMNNDENGRAFSKDSATPKFLCAAIFCCLSPFRHGMFSNQMEKPETKINFQI